MSSKSNYIPRPSGGSDDGPLINGTLDIAGSITVLGPGTYRLRTGVTMALSGLSLIGSGVGATTLLVDDSVGNIGDAVRLVNTSGCSVSNLTISAVSPRTVGTAIKIIGTTATESPLTAPRTIVRDVALRSQFNGIIVENDTTIATSRNFKTYLKDLDIADISTGGTGIWINAATSYPTLTAASHFIENAWIFDEDRSSLAGIRLTSTGDVTLTNNEVFGPDIGLLLDPTSGAMLTSVTVLGGFYDRSTTACLRIAPNAAVGAFGAINFDGVWFAGSTSGNVAEITGAAAKLINFVGCTFYSAEGSPAWCAKVNAANNIDFTGCNFAGGRTGGVLFTGSASGFSVGASRFTAAGVGTGLPGMPTGIQVDAGCDHYRITDNDLSDAAVGGTAKITNTPGTSAARRIVQDNVTA